MFIADGSLFEQIFNLGSICSLVALAAPFQSNLWTLHVCHLSIQFLSLLLGSVLLLYVCDCVRYLRHYAGMRHIGAYERLVDAGHVMPPPYGTFRQMPPPPSYQQVLPPSYQEAILAVAAEETAPKTEDDQQ